MSEKKNKPVAVRNVEPLPELPAVPLGGVCLGHGCRECFMDRAAIALHHHGVTPNKAFREAEALWLGRLEFMKGRKS